MHQFLKKILILISALFVSNCSIYKYNHGVEQIKNSTESTFPSIIKSNYTLKYQATIDVFKNHLSGLLFIKQTDSITKHILFITQLGMKMFDFEIKTNDLNVVYLFESLNNKLFLESLKKNLSNIFLLGIEKLEPIKYLQNQTKTIFYRIDVDNNKKFYTLDSSFFLTKQETFHKQKLESKINYSYNRTTNSYSHIKCKQYGLIKIYFEFDEL